MQAMSAETAGPDTRLTVDRQTNSITLVRRVAAPPAEVFAAWTQPEQISQWWDPTGEPLAGCEIDLRVGGSFRLVPGAGEHPPFTGRYVEITPPGRLVFEANGAIGTVALAGQGGTTVMTVTIACASAEHLASYLQLGVEKGTGRTLDNLVAYMAGRSVAMASTSSI